MKTNRLIFIILLLLAGAAVYVYMNNDRTTLKEDLSDFAIPDTASVTKFFLADRQGREITLERLESGNWELNGKYGVRRDLLDVLLRTVANVQLKAPISKKAHNAIIRNMSSKAQKIEIYTVGTLAKTYYVGNSAKDNLGTYMLIENSSVPYVTHLPGFNGYLTPRYSTVENEWRNTLICDYRVSEVKSIDITYHNKPENSFRIDRLGQDQYKVTATSPETVIANFDSVSVRRYLLGLRKVHFESFEERKGIDRDSVLAGPKLVTLKIEPVVGEVIKIDAWRMSAGEGAVNLDGNPIKWDIDRMHATINDDPELIFVQYFTLDRLLVSLDQFEPDTLLRRDN
ncbi:MAG: hypothetical protein ACI97X_000892 [Oceanospirillaceae bacterium]|jgi:hypothetical protein